MTIQKQPNQRRIRGIDLAKRFTIKEKDNFWHVPSASGKGKYKVDLFTESCTCPDYEFRRAKCKHLFAVEFTFEQDFLDSIDSEENSKLAKKKKTYPQIWTAYNSAQINEKAQFQRLLSELTKGIGEPSQKNGRPRLPLEDMLFACVYKVYSTFSSRRFSTDLKVAKQKGFIENTPHFNSISRYLDKELLTPYLEMMIEESSLPLTAFEKTFSIDASGLSTNGTFTWHFAKHTEPRLIDKKDWLKIHCCVGNLTNIITAVEISEKYDNDHPYFETLVKQTAEHFRMDEVSGDAAYLSRDNLQTAIDYGAYPYIAWKANSKISDRKGNELWNKMFHYFSLNKEKFLERYHQRSNSETTFWMIKSKFSGKLRSKNRTAQKNEALAKILCHNLCCLIQSIYELGLKPEFWKELH